MAELASAGILMLPSERYRLRGSSLSNTGLQTDDLPCHGPCWRTVRAKSARS